MSEQRSEELKSTNYELFILALAFLSIFNWILYFTIDDQDVVRVIQLVDLLISIIFMADFAYRILTAPSKRRYFFKELGWLDLISSFPLPQFKITRLARIVRAVILLRKLGYGSIRREFFRDRAQSAVYLVAFLIIVVLEFGSTLVLAAEEGAPGSNIETAGEAMWWALVTMSTVGYGDYVPVTPAGRVIGVLVLILGVALFGVVTGFLANQFVEPVQNGPESGQPPLSRADLQPLIDEIAALRSQHQQSQSELEQKLEAMNSSLQELAANQP